MRPRSTSDAAVQRLIKETLLLAATAVDTAGRSSGVLTGAYEPAWST